jgi:hypothetical protein
MNFRAPAPRGSRPMTNQLAIQWRLLLSLSESHDEIRRDSDYTGQPAVGLSIVVADSALPSPWPLSKDSDSCYSRSPGSVSRHSSPSATTTNSRSIFEVYAYGYLYGHLACAPPSL